MKFGILLISGCISLTAIGQEIAEKEQKLEIKSDSVGGFHMPSYPNPNKLVIYQDSVKMPQNAYWDHPEPKEFKDLKIVKSKEEPSKATIYLETKNPRSAKSFNFLNLKDIERIYTGAKKSNTLLVFNNQVVVNYREDIKIDSSFIRSVEVINSGEVTQLQDKLSEFRILNVKLNWKNHDGVPKHLATAGVPKFYFAPAEKKEIKLVLPSETAKTKEVREFRFLNLKDIEKKYTGSTSQSTLFFWTENC